jgi:Domain of unknown function (DUF4157)
MPLQEPEMGSQPAILTREPAKLAKQASKDAVRTTTARHPFSVCRKFAAPGGTGAPKSFSRIPALAANEHSRAISICESDLRLPLQRKLTIGSVSDPLESEADAMAERVMRMSGPAEPTPDSRAPAIRRKCACGGSDVECAECREERENTLQRKAVNALAAIKAPPIVHETVAKSGSASKAGSNGGRSDTAPPIVNEVLGSPGRPLDQATRSFFEPWFRQDFSSVRLHTDSRAEESTKAVSARAYTVGRHVVFGTGCYCADSREGRQLLAHELTHVVQQARSSPQLVQRQSDPDVDGMRQDFENAVAGAQSEHAAEVLNGFNLTDIQKILTGRPSSQIAAIHVGALANSNVGPESQVARVTRPAYLDVNYRESLAAGEWQAAAKYLNGFNRNDIIGRLRRLNSNQIDAIHGGAVANLEVGDQSQVALLAVQVLSDRSAQAAPAPAATSGAPPEATAPTEVTDAGPAVPEAQPVPATAASSGTPPSPGAPPPETTAPTEVTDAGPSVAEVQPVLGTPPADQANRTRQLLCVIRLGGCANARDGGLPTQSEIDSYNETCKGETGYIGDNISPSTEECANPPPEPAELPVGECPSTVDPAVAQLSTADKLRRAWDFAKDFIGSDAQAALAELFSPSSIAAMIGFAVLFIVVEGTPAGWVADAVTAIFVGKLLFDIIGNLLEFFSAINASNDCELRRDGHALSQAIIQGGLLLVMELLSRKGSGGQRYDAPPPADAIDAVTSDGAVIRMPKDAAASIAKESSVEVRGGELGPRQEAAPETGPKAGDTPQPTEKAAHETSTGKEEPSETPEVQMPRDEDPAGGLKAVDEAPSVDGKRKIKITEDGGCEVCASPCEDIRSKYGTELTENSDWAAQLDEASRLTDVKAQEAEFRRIEQLLADAKAAKGSGSGTTASSRLRPQEAKTMERLEKMGIDVKESAHVGAEYEDAQGRSYDQMGDPRASQYWNQEAFEASIQDHLLKQNEFTVIDMTDFTAVQQQAVSDYVSRLSPGQQAKIIKVGF